LKKTIKFELDAQKLYDRALKKSDAEQFVAALDLINRAETARMSEERAPDIKSRKRSYELSCALKLERAEIYFRIGLIDKALLEYFKIYHCPYHQDVYMGIIHGFMRLGLVEQALYYFKKGVAMGALGDADDIDMLQQVVMSEIVLPDNKRPNLQLVSKHEDKLYDIARQMLRRGEDIVAAHLLSKIPEGNDHYVEASCIRALIHLARNEIDLAQECVQGLDDKLDDLLVACTMLQLHHTNQDEQAKSYICQKIEQSGYAQYGECKRIASTMSQIGEDALALKYYERALVTAPYDWETLLLSAIAAYNCGKPTLARDKLVTMTIINNGDYIAQSYCQLIAQAPQRLEYTTNLQEREYNRNIDDIVNLLQMEDEQQAEYILHNDNDDVLRWVFTCGKPTLACEVASVLIHFEYWHDFFIEILLDLEYDLSLRKAILNLYLLRQGSGYKQSYRGINGGLKHEIDININGIINQVVPCIPTKLAKVDKVYTVAYWVVFTALAYMGTLFEDDFCKAVADMVKRLGVRHNELTDVGTLAALMAYIYGKTNPLLVNKVSHDNANAIVYSYDTSKPFGNKKQCLNTFGGNKKLFEQYLAAIRPKTSKIRPKT
jgi:tetratricopeptide (TPR) repeat protein